MSQANIAVVQDLYAAFGRGDVATILDGLAPDVDWCSVGRASDFPAFGPRSGHAAVADFFKTVAENETFSEFLPQEFHASGDKVFVTGRYSLTMTKTGRPATCEWVHVFTLRDGKVARWREHTDTAQFAAVWHG